jgi:omega-6 fatty acid desaturase (delta-12 desaturase)
MDRLLARSMATETMIDAASTADRIGIAAATGAAGGNAALLSPHDVRSRVAECRRKRSTAKALALFVPIAVLYGVTLTATVLAPSWPLRLAAAAANAVVLSILFVLGHDACHGAFTPHRWLNELLGRLALLPSWHPYAGWQHAHNHVHHVWTNLRPKDYAWAPLSKTEYDNLSRLARWRVRFYRSALGFGCYYFWEVYVKRTILPSREFWGNSRRTTLNLDLALVAGFIVLQAAYLLFLARWSGAADSPMSVFAVLAAGQWLPFAIWNWLIGFLTFLHHTHPRVPWFNDRGQWSFFSGQIQGSVHVIFPWGINWMIQRIMEHTAHHADPHVPLYELAAAQRALEQAFCSDVVVHAFSFKSLLATTSACQLYNFEQHHWLSYEGERTSGPTILINRANMAASAV